MTDEYEKSDHNWDERRHTPSVTVEQDVTLCFTCSIEWLTLELGAIHTARNRRPRDRSISMLVAQCGLRFLRTPEASGGAASGSGGGGGESTPS